MKLIPKVSKEAKQTLMGGLVSSLAVNLESGLSWFVPGYPQFLKDKVIAQLPRNGALVANLAPVGVSYYIKKKGRSSAKMENMATGMMLYDLPKFLDQLVYNIAYEAGRPQGGMGMAGKQVFNLSIKPINGNGFRPPVMSQAYASSGKYGTPYTATKAVAGLGKYR